MNSVTPRDLDLDASPSIPTRRSADAQKTTEHRHSHRSPSPFDSPLGLTGPGVFHRERSQLSSPSDALLIVTHLRIKHHHHSLLDVRRDTEETLGEECYIMRPHRLDEYNTTLWTRFVTSPTGSLIFQGIPSSARRGCSYIFRQYIEFERERV